MAFNLELVGIIAEVVGAGAVVVTLIFLTRETRLNRNAAESHSVDSSTGGLNALNLGIANDPEISDIWLRGHGDPDALSDLEQMRFALVGQTLVNQLTAVKKHFDAGSLPESEWSTYYSGICQLMTSPGGQWLLQNIAIPPEIVQIIDEYPRDESRPVLSWRNKRT